MVTGDIFGNKYRLYAVMKTSGSKLPDVEKAYKEQRHGFGRGVWKEVEPLQDEFDMQIYANKTAWWNSDISVAYLDSLFGHRTPASEPIMLLLDHFSGHWTDDVVARAKSLNIVLKKIPAGLTWRAQPADVAWIKGFKDAIRRSWVDELRAQLAHHRQATPTATFALVPPDRRKISAWIADAWAGVRGSTIINGFVRCGYIDRPAGASVDVEDEAETLDASDVVASLVEHSEVIGRPLTEEMDVVDREEAIESEGEEEE